MITRNAHAEKLGTQKKGAKTGVRKMGNLNKGAKAGDTIKQGTLEERERERERERATFKRETERDPQSEP
jgi:hypothetical protein